MLLRSSRDLRQELNQPKSNPDSSTRIPGQESKPIPVEVRQPPPTALESLVALISPLLRPLTTTGIVAIFVVFILLQREDLRNRFIKLAGSHDLQKTTAALDDGARRLSRLFLFQVGLNTAFGLVIGTGLWIIGVPNPALWGILSGVLRFVPYVGAAISAIFPLVLAAAVDPGWTMLLWTAGLFLVARTTRRSGDRAARVRAQHGLVTDCCRYLGDFLDRALGPNWSYPSHAFDGMPGRARTARRPFRVS